MKYLVIVLLAIALTVSKLQADSDSVDMVFDKMIAAHPYDLSACLIDHSPANECEAPDALKKMKLTSQINIEVILDVSGSMAGQINGQSKYGIATQALNEFVDILPKHVNLSLRVYGHKGSNKEADKSLSCQSSALIYPFQKLDSESFMASVNSFKPTGWTALGHSLEQALLDFNRFNTDSNTNIIYLLTDGKETCGGDPVSAATAIKASNVNAVVNAIGFDVATEDRLSIEKISDAGGGEYFSANNLEELTSVLTDATSWREWQQHFECRWTTANRHIRAIQDIELNRYNCILDLASANTSLIQADLLKNHSNVEFDVMSRVLEYQYQIEEPHAQRYNTDSYFNSYSKELEAIEKIRQQLDATQ